MMCSIEYTLLHQCWLHLKGIEPVCKCPAVSIYLLYIYFLAFYIWHVCGLKYLGMVHASRFAFCVSGFYFSLWNSVQNLCCFIDGRKFIICWNTSVCKFCSSSLWGFFLGFYYYTVSVFLMSSISHILFYTSYWDYLRLYSLLHEPIIDSSSVWISSFSMLWGYLYYSSIYIVVILCLSVSICLPVSFSLCHISVIFWRYLRAMELLYTFMQFIYA